MFARVVGGDDGRDGDVDEDNVDGGQAGQRKGDVDEDGDGDSDNDGHSDGDFVSDNDGNSDSAGAQVGQREGDRLPSHCVSSSWPGRGETWVRFVPHKSLFPIFNISRNPCLMI